MNLVMLKSREGMEGVITLHLYKDGKFVEGSMTDFDTNQEPDVEAIKSVIEEYRNETIVIEDEDAHASTGPDAA